MASGWFGGRAIELVKARSLFVKVFPTPASLSERRAVLHALRRYGQIEVFKRLPNPETFVCAPTTSESASKILNRSPLTFNYITETLETIEAKSHPGMIPVGVAPPIHVHEDNARLPLPGTPARKAASETVKTFTMHVNPSQSYYEHKTNVRLAPIHGPWPKTPEQDQDFVYFALREAVVPRDIAHEGLCDWHTGGQLSGEPAAIRARQASSKLYHIRERQLRRMKSRELGGDEGSTLVALKSLDGPRRPGDNKQGSYSPTPSDRSEETKQSGQCQEQMVEADSFVEMERVAREGGDPGESATRPEVPPWTRRKRVKLNPLADGRRYKADKYMPIPDLKGEGRWYEFRSVYKPQVDTTRQMDEVRPLMGQLDGNNR